MAYPSYTQQKLSINVNGSLIDLQIPKVMGILNLTPDSFYDGGVNSSVADALETVKRMLMEGADFIDIGAYSSRPNAEDISDAEELKRLLPTLKATVKEFPNAIISIDTFRANVASAAINEGAHIINDISGGELDATMFETVASLKVPYILMHMKGSPQTMLKEAKYGDVFKEVLNYFLSRIKKLQELGVKDVIIDPGFGFAKKPEHSFELLNRLDELKILDVPILAGLSRKSMIYKSLGITPEDALNGTTVANTIALLKGANILRVHDVKAASEAIKLVQQLNPKPYF
ncbi:MAG: Dihydropteroate synthase [Daejeonella sp.]|nr:Dihydropteroate synthase [Daejeonella sp.]